MFKSILIFCISILLNHCSKKNSNRDDLYLTALFLQQDNGTVQSKWTYSKWTRQVGATSEYTYGYGTVTDSSGNIYITGYTSGGLDGNTQTGTYDVFLIKYDNSGNKIWTRQMGVASQSVYGSAITTDSNGNVYITGSTSGGLNGNTQTGSNDVFVVKYDTNGNTIWTKQIGVSSKSAFGSGIITDSNANVYITGQTSGGLDGNTQTGSFDAFVIKYDTDGNKVWARQTGVSSKSYYGYQVTTDSSANVYITGASLDFTSTSKKTRTSVAGISNSFVIKYDSSGNKLWEKQVGVASTYSTYGYGIVTDTGGNIYITGSTSEGLDGNTRIGISDVFVTKYDASGNKIWTKQTGATSAETTGKGIVSDSGGNIYVAGHTKGALAENTLTGTTDAFIIKYDTNGTKIWTKQMGVVSKNTYGLGLTLDSSANIYVTGQTNGGADGNALSGSYDMFVTSIINQ